MGLCPLKQSDKTLGPGFSKHLKSVTMVTCLSSKFPYRNTVLSFSCFGIYLC